MRGKNVDGQVPKLSCVSDASTSPTHSSANARRFNTGDALTHEPVDRASHPMKTAWWANQTDTGGQKGERPTGTDTVRLKRSGIRHMPKLVSRKRGRGGRIRREAASILPC